MQKTNAVLGSALFFVIAPCLARGMPWFITGREVHPSFFGLEFIRANGLVLILLGLPAPVDSFARFALHWLGTPAPVAPPQHLGRASISFCANSDVRWVISIGLGQVLLLADWHLFDHGAVFWLACHVFVVVYEEPTG
jgi:hypothetical protein